jgi:FG-GAP-like repeat
VRYAAVALVFVGLLAGCSKEVRRRGSATGGLANPVCTVGTSAGPVHAPVFVRNIPSGETGWFASPVVSDLGDPASGQKIVAAYYTLFVYDASGSLLDSAAGNGSRIYAPHVVTDLEGDGVYEIVVGQGDEVIAYEWIPPTPSVPNGHLRLKWRFDTTTAGDAPEVRGLAAADLDRDGNIEVVATTTQTRSARDGGAQVFVLDSAGHLFPGWPRYNDVQGDGGDADRNGAGLDGYGCYGLNVGIGNIDDDPGLEIIVTYDNHEIEAFHHDGVAIDASPWFSNPSSEYLGRRLTWGQFIRWADPKVEEDHYHLHVGEWPDINKTEWLQWTASPPNVVDLNGDGRNEVVGVPNVEMHEPYVTQAYAVMALEGAYGDGSRSAMRLAGWETLPRGEAPVIVEGWYPPAGIPAAATVDIQGDARPEIVVSLNDAHVHAFDADARELWYYNYAKTSGIRYASEPAVADLNRDGSPEIVFTTYGDPDTSDSGRLVILAANGAEVYDAPLLHQARDGNGNGAPAAPTIADLDGDGQLEILVQTFDHGLDVYRVPGSGTGCLLWPTSRGGPLRMGAPNGN